MPNSINYTPSHCDSVLIPDRETIASDELLKTTSLDVISEESWNSMKSDQKAGLSAFFDGVTIGADWSWNQFKEARQSYFQRKEFTSDYKSSYQYVSVKVSPDARTKWLQCILGVQNSVEPQVFCFNESAKTLNLSFVFKVQARPNANQEIEVTRSTLTGGKCRADNVPLGAAVPSKFKFTGGKPELFAYDREDGNPFSLSIETQVGGIAFDLPPYHTSETEIKDTDLALSTTSLTPTMNPYGPYQPDWVDPNKPFKCNLRGRLVPSIEKSATGAFDIYMLCDIGAVDTRDGADTGMAQSNTGWPSPPRIKIASVSAPNISNVELRSDLSTTISFMIDWWNRDNSLNISNNLVQNINFNPFSRSLSIQLNPRIPVRITTVT